jgi:hypothetical protein
MYISLTLSEYFSEVCAGHDCSQQSYGISRILVGHRMRRSSLQ